MREIRARSFSFLKDRRTVIASADRIFIAALTHLFDGNGPLVGAATSEQDALNYLAANDVQLLVCTDRQRLRPGLGRRSESPASPTALLDVDSEPPAQHHLQQSPLAVRAYAAVNALAMEEY